jgi:hypothetical protein
MNCDQVYLVLIGRAGYLEVWFLRWYHSTTESGMLKVYIHVLICSSVMTIIYLETACKLMHCSPAMEAKFVRVLSQG